MANCLKPYYDKEKNMPLPCGKCIECKTKRISTWAFRLMMETKRSTSAYFLTLTYDDKHINKTDNGFMTLKKSDVQTFIKNIRKANQAKLKYYCAAEYGTNYKRPHYHIILFNANVETLMDNVYKLATAEGTVKLDGKHEIKSKHWKHGYLTIGQVNIKSVQYSLGYINKPYKVPEHERDDRQKEFSLMSKRLGDNYLTEKNIQIHRETPTKRCQLRLEDNKIIPLPKYYKDKIFDDQMKSEIQESIKNQEHEEISTIGVENYLKQKRKQLRNSKHKEIKNNGKPRN